MKLSTNAKLVLVVLIVGAAIYGLFKFYPSKETLNTTEKSDSLKVKVDSVKVAVDTVKVIADTTPVVAPVKVVKQTSTKKKKETTIVSKPKKKVTKTENESNDFVPNY